MRSRKPASIPRKKEAQYIAATVVGGWVALKRQGDGVRNWDGLEVEVATGVVACYVWGNAAEGKQGKGRGEPFR